MRAISLLALALISACGKPPSPPASNASAPPAASPLDRAAAFATRSTADRHEGWLEIVDDLEALREASPRDAGVLRDLLVAYGQLLAYERATPLGSNLCLVASRRMGEFERLASPLSIGDHDLVWHLRAWVAFVMGMSPLAAEACSTVKDPGRADEIRRSLDALGQRSFHEGANFACGQLRIRPFLNRDACPSDDLLWPERCYVAAPREDPAPDRTAMIAVCRMEGRWSLWVFALNRRELVMPLGPERPEERVVRSHVVRLFSDAEGAR
jgi:hypothetical protein